MVCWNLHARHLTCRVVNAQPDSWFDIREGLDVDASQYAGVWSTY